MTSKQVKSPPWNSRRLVHSKEMVWASRWSVALRTFYRQILSLLYIYIYSSFFFWNFRPRLARELLVLYIWLWPVAHLDYDAHWYSIIYWIYWSIYFSCLFGIICKDSAFRYQQVLRQNKMLSARVRPPNDDQNGLPLHINRTCSPLAKQSGLPTKTFNILASLNSYGNQTTLFNCNSVPMCLSPKQAPKTSVQEPYLTTAASSGRSAPKSSQLSIHSSGRRLSA